jgi:uncharacterized protein
MSATMPGPVSARERLDVIDALRGLAIGGIMIGNMQWFSGYGMAPPVLAEQAPAVDRVTHFLVHVLVEGKFYSIFSFLFGFGFALQVARAEERGDVDAAVFRRRLWWLLLIGLLHAWLLWAGDIVSIYALMGFLLLRFRRTSNTALVKWAVVLVIVPVVTYTLITVAFHAFVPPETIAGFETGQTERWSSTVSTVRESSWLKLTTDFNVQGLAGRYAGLIVQMRLPKILAMFLLGLYAYRLGVFQNPAAHAPLIRRVLVRGLAFGLVGNVAMAALAGNEGPFPPSVEGILGVAAYAFAVPALALGLAALVVTLWRSDGWRRLLSVLAPVGRMALTNYLLQTVICVTLFYGYGFGLFARFRAGQATLIAFAIFVVQIILSAVWLRYFAWGPMEWLWRQLTYGRRLPLLKAPREAEA